MVYACRHLAEGCKFGGMDQLGAGFFQGDFRALSVANFSQQQPIGLGEFTYSFQNP